MTTSEFAIPTQAEIDATVRRAHVMRAKAVIAVFTSFGDFLKSIPKRIGFRKPNLVRTFLEA